MLAPAHVRDIFLGFDTDRLGVAGVLLGAAVSSRLSATATNSAWRQSQHV